MKLLHLIFHFSIFNYVNAQQGGGMSLQANHKYTCSSMVLCEQIDNSGLPAGSSRRFVISGNSGKLYIYISNGKNSLNTSLIILDVYKNDKLYETKFISVSPASAATSILYTLYKSARYTFIAYDENHTWINTAGAWVLRKGEEYFSPDYSGSVVYFTDPAGTILPLLQKNNILEIEKGGSVCRVEIKNSEPELHPGKYFAEIEKDHILYDEKTVSVPDKTGVFSFSFLFRLPGTYEFRIYDGYNNWINTETLQVVWKQP